MTGLAAVRTVLPLLCCAFTPGVVAQAPTDVSATLESIRAEHGVPGLSGALLRDGRVVAIGAAGVRRLGHDAAVTSTDQWHLGSCTKAMTATAIARLVERGTLRFDATLADVFGDDAADWHAGYRAVTLRELLDHEAGLPRDFPLASHFAATGKTGAAIAEGRRAALEPILREAPPGTRGEHAYSNVGFVLAGHALEHATGRTWEEVIRAEVFVPLGMTTAGFGEPGTAGEVDQPWGHTAAGVARPPGRPGSDLPPIYGPAGLVHGSLADWARFVDLHLRGKDGYLAPATLTALHTPARAGGEYACGWAVVERGWAAGEVLAHTGSNLSWFCCVWASPKDGFAVLAACNQGPPRAAEACDAVAGALIRLAKDGARDR